MDEYDPELDELEERDKAVTIRLPKAAVVKNKMPAPLQITAEQLIREAKERELELIEGTPKNKITDPEELDAYRLAKRREYEDGIRKNRVQMQNWIKYAEWEESQREIQRARSIYERGLDVEHRCVPLWLKYAEMEMRNRHVNSARNIWDRAVTILPRANQFWYKYTYMEEMLQNVAGARQVFERWMQWQPEEQAWYCYINFELRYKEVNRARAIYERFVIVHPEVKNWIKYARFEERHHYTASARKIFERAVEFFGEDNIDPHLLIAFAKFEENQKEHERARVIYKYGLDRLPKSKCEEIYKHFSQHEKRFGDRGAIEDVIVSKRRFQYEEEVKADAHNYDAWFDYIRLLENESDVDTVRETYERAIANLPPIKEKRHWRRYIYLWINYAVFEELNAEDLDRTKQVYEACLQLLPHKLFTFSKIWLLYAKFEIRRKNIGAARRVLGTALGKCPRDKLFRGYIELEIELREFDRCRTLYTKFLEFNPANCTTWMKFAEMEGILGDTVRCRAIFELAVDQPILDMPEILWKSYIDFEISGEEWDRARMLYRRLLRRTQHVKVWLSYAKMELSIGAGKEEGDHIEKARKVYAEAFVALRRADDKEERLMLIEHWRKFEEEHGDSAAIEQVESQMPERVKKRRKVTTEDGAEAGWEEYYDYIFPDDAAAQPNLKLLNMAKQWKQNVDSDESSSESDSDEEADEPEPSSEVRGAGNQFDDDDDDEEDAEVDSETQEKIRRNEELMRRIEREMAGEMASPERSTDTTNDQISDS